MKIEVTRATVVDGTRVEAGTEVETSEETGLMTVDAHFNAAASEIVESRGASATYTQSATPLTVNVMIDHELEIVDPDSGGSNFVTAAVIAKSEFTFSQPLPGDTILQDGRTWNVTRQLEDDGYFLTLEVI